MSWHVCLLCRQFVYTDEWFPDGPEGDTVYVETGHSPKCPANPDSITGVAGVSDEPPTKVQCPDCGSIMFSDGPKCGCPDTSCPDCGEPHPCPSHPPPS